MFRRDAPKKPVRYQVLGRHERPRNDGDDSTRRRPFPKRDVSRDISAGQKLRKVTSANNKRESFADYKLDYLSLDQRELIPLIAKSFCPKVERVSLVRGTDMYRASIELFDKNEKKKNKNYDDY